MKKIAFLFFIIALFSSCEDSSVSSGRKLYKLYFNKILKNPKSLVIHSEKYTKENEFTVNWVLDIGAENSYGGMVRKTYEMKTVSDAIFVDGEIYRKKDLE